MEGPSLVIAQEEFEPLLGRKIQAVTGVKAEELSWLKGKSLTETRSWGKHFLMLIGDRVLRIHFLMFGSYRLNSFREDREPKLHLKFAGGDDLYFYSCAIKEIDGPIDQIYDWGVDIMSPSWNEKKVMKLVLANPDEQVADILMDQNIFAGSGNIIKNEVLYRLHLHPEALVRDLSLEQQKSLIRETRRYGDQFYEWKKIGKLKANWLIFRKRTCRRCDLPVIKRPTGKLQRFSHYCENCQFMGDLASKKKRKTTSKKSAAIGASRKQVARTGSRSRATGSRRMTDSDAAGSARASRIATRATRSADKTPKH